MAGPSLSERVGAGSWHRVIDGSGSAAVLEHPSLMEEQRLLTGDQEFPPAPLGSLQGAVSQCKEVS